MNANEFRIGNLLRDKVSKTELKVIGLNEYDILTYVIDRSKYPLKDGWAIEPIPLTEERLLKFGFEKKENGYFIKCGIRLYPIRDLYYRGDFPIKADIIYVHQLQNLYFALTNEELEVK